MDKIDPLSRIRSETAMSAVLMSAIRTLLASLGQERLWSAIKSVRAGARSITITTDDTLVNTELSYHREAIAHLCTGMLRTAKRYALPEDMTIRFR